MLIWPATRFVAGETVEGAYDRVERLNEVGVSGLIDELGEHVHDREEAEAVCATYLDVLEGIDERGLDGCISVKPTHLGLEVDEDLCRDNLLRLAEEADERGLFVWVDMESSDHTDETIELYLDMLEVTDRAGICLQCYLRRTGEDIRRVVDAGGMVRLVKGAYDEPADIAFQGKEEVDRSYRELLQELFEREARFAVATHDADLVDRARELHGEHDPEQFEFQFLMGLRDGMKKELAAEGYDVAEYIPYGDDWMAYYWRRAMERKQNLLFAIRSLFSLGRDRI